MGVLTMEIEKNRKDTINEIERIEKEKEKRKMLEEDKKQFERDYKKALEADLYYKIYEQFENNLEELGEQIPQDEAIDILYNSLLLIDIKKVAINETADKTSDKEYLQTKYKNIINKIKMEFLEDYKARYKIDADFRKKQNELKINKYSIDNNNITDNTKENNIKYLSSKIILFFTSFIHSILYFLIAYLLKNTFINFINWLLIPRVHYMGSNCNLYHICSKYKIT